MGMGMAPFVLLTLAASIPAIVGGDGEWGWEDVLTAALRLNQTLTYKNGDRYDGEMV